MPLTFRTSLGSVFALLSATLFFGPTPSYPTPRSHPAQIQSTAQFQDLALYEAEILIYLIPEARKDRESGRRVSWELQESDKLNQRDFFTFWVVGPPNPYGSSTIGYFSVNKHSAEVWDAVLFKRVDDAELKGVQEILRKAHQIEAQTVEKYHDVSP